MGERREARGEREDRRLKIEDRKKKEVGARSLTRPFFIIQTVASK